MRRRILHIIAVLFLSVSCVTPEEITILENERWSVFGLLGEEDAPMFFVYTNTEFGTFQYRDDADITLTDKQTGAEYRLSAKRKTANDFIASSAFPFDFDLFGNLVLYTSDDDRPLPSADYDISIEFDDVRGTAEAIRPEVVEFASIEVRLGAEGSTESDQIFLAIDDQPGADHYKWSVTVDEIIDVQQPLEYNDQGEPVSFTTEPFEVSILARPNRYITEEVIEERENQFNYNLSTNIPDFDFTTEEYQIQIQLLHFSDEFSEYLYSIEDQQNGAVFDPFIEPIFIKSNIDGIPGAIGTYAVSADYVVDYKP